MNATSSTNVPKYVMTAEGLFRVLDDGTHLPIHKPKPMPAGVILSEDECELRRAYWGGLKEWHQSSSSHA